jgi:carboxypeptidase Taq
MITCTPDYDSLTALHQRIHRLEHLLAMASWDRASYMPPKGNEARTAALAELVTLIHGWRTDPSIRARIERTQRESLCDEQRANLREIRRGWEQASALPVKLIERREVATSRCEHAWRTQRRGNDWTGFLENFLEVVGIAREEAQRLSDQLGVGPYEALMHRFEPGMRCKTLDRLFGAIRSWLPNLLAKAFKRQEHRPCPVPSGPFPVEAQRRVCEQAMRLLGFDFEAGRLDVSAHPFCGGTPEDVRMTTRFREDEFLGSLMGTVHETGHGCYEQNLPRQSLGQPIALARSMAIHESQSLSFEMQLGGHPGFARLLSPLLCDAFGHQPAFESDSLHRLITRVHPGLIRVEADEVSYPAHIILRYEIERPLIEGTIEAQDIPALWDLKMDELLGLDTRGNYADGPLQDVHWPEGLFGYFPCYTLGAMYAAQWFATLRRQRPQIDVEIASGHLEPVLVWLKNNIWTQGSRWTTEELVLRASGEALNAEYYRHHLAQRYTDG